MSPTVDLEKAKKDLKDLEYDVANALKNNFYHGVEKKKLEKTKS